jgi:hypothetical protein
MTQMRKKVVIEDRAKFVRFKNRKIRTPVTLEINSDSELKQLKVSMKMADVQNWKVVVESDKTNEVIDYDYEEPQESVIEELENGHEEPKTILEKLMKDGDFE